MVDSVFDRLAKELSTQERKDMLIQLRTALPQEKMVVRHDKSESPIDTKKIYKESPWWEKLILFIKHILFGKEIDQLVEEHCLKNIQRKLKKDSSPWFDIDNERATQEFFQLLEKLRKSLEPFREIVDRIGREKRDFVFFLGNRCFMSIREDMWQNTDPNHIHLNHADLRINQIKERAQSTFDFTFESIAPEKRSQFKWQAKAIHQLQQLCEFPLFAMVSLFKERGPSGVEASWHDIKFNLMSLFDIIYSFKVFPESDLIEPLLIFTYRERFIEEPAEETSRWMKALYQQINTLKEVLIEWSGVPMQDLLRFISSDLNYTPNDIGGGEDYFHIYKKTWQQKLDARFAAFVNQQKILEIQKGLIGTWGVEKIGLLGRYSPEFSNLYEFRYVHTISLLYHFYQELIKEKNYPVMDIVWKRGEFYKKDNAREFDEVMQFIHSSPEGFQIFLEKLDEEGFYGTRLKEILKNHAHQQELQEREVKLLFATIDQEARTWIVKLMNHLYLLGALLTGILLGERGNYDTLSNYADLAGPPNRQFKDELVTREFLVNNAFRNINDIFGLEEKANL